MIDSDLRCAEEKRRDDVRSASLFGLDYIEVSAEQTTLTVFFLGKAPTGIEKNNLVIAGGTRIKGIQVTGIIVHRQKDTTVDDSMDVRVNQPGDFSTYRLSVVAVEKGRPTTGPMAGFDPLFSQVDFTFKGSCATGIDCLPQTACPPPQYSQPEINYLAKDYASFRQLILDRMALTIPAWQEEHEPDLGVALVELLAYAGDYLSYYQDAVATEAYLGTARQRISVRRHVRLIDYVMHEGCNARAWLTLSTDTDEQFDLSQVFFITAFSGAPVSHVLTLASLENVPTTSYEIFQPLLPATGTLSIYQAHSEIYFYTWGDQLCCLAPGTTAATLIDGAPASKETDNQTATTRILQLNVGDVLIFEEVLGPKTGNPADADSTHRQAVRLTKVTPSVDALYGQPILEIEWSGEDALTFPLCLSSQMPVPPCTVLENVSVARGNVVLVDHGSTTIESLGVVATASTTANCPSPCHPQLVTIAPGKYRPTLAQRPLTFSQPLPSVASSASQLIVQDPRQALPDITLASIPAAPASVDTDTSSLPPLFTFDDLTNPTNLVNRLQQLSDVDAQYLSGQLSAATRASLAAWNGAAPLPTSLATQLEADLKALLENWVPLADLLENGPNDFSFVVEMDNAGDGHLRFGDGRLGRQPAAGMAFQANYRFGNGPSGNVGAETITYLVLRNETLSGTNIQPRNPLAATGATSPEPISEVKMLAPHAFQDVIERAITADDYAALAEDNPRRLEQRPAADSIIPFAPLQGAKATLRWTGAWYEALVAIDPIGTEQAPAELLREVHTYLRPYRRIGHDLTVAPANYIPLDLALSVCVLPDYLRGNVEESLLQVFGNGVLPDGRNGFFNPNNLTFGEGIYVSQIVAAAQAITGVASVNVTRLQRFQNFAHAFPPIFGLASGAVPPLGVLPFGPFEIAQLDNDPNFPEHGRLELSLRGGR